ncbi:MAG: acetyl-CoA C-acetyltransferase [Gammaproteobacteria bacterium]|nr:acetyl-CoA C-acetyltransferase [Gammaproteobacteria bacterium]
MRDVILKVKNKSSRVFVVDGTRTPFLKAKGVGPMSASDLAVQAGTALFNRLPIQANQVDEVIIGAAMPGPDEANIARIIAMRLGCGDKVPAFTVMRNCASGMQAIDTGAQNIAMGHAQMVVVGGTEAMSRAPILYDLAMANWLANWMTAKGFAGKAKMIAAFRPNFLLPIIGLLRGLTDPLIGMNMGQTAEELAYRFGIDRLTMDEFAYKSHHALAKAYAEGLMSEVTPIVDARGQVYTQDTGLRADVTLEGLAKLRPVFDKKFGQVTAGNSSQVTDGACMLLLASEAAIKAYKLPVLGEIIDCDWQALDPKYMGLGPAHAVASLLAKHDMNFNDIDILEINEAFAVQVLACLEAWNDSNYCQEALGLKNALGAFDLKKLNAEGGAIAAGHPIGASGARIVLHVLNMLKKKNLKRGIATLCIGGGQGGAMLLETGE